MLNSMMPSVVLERQLRGRQPHHLYAIWAMAAFKLQTDLAQAQCCATERCSKAATAGSLMMEAATSTSESPRPSSVPMGISTLPNDHYQIWMQLCNTPMYADLSAYRIHIYLS